MASSSSQSASHINTQLKSIVEKVAAYELARNKEFSLITEDKYRYCPTSKSFFKEIEKYLEKKEKKYIPYLCSLLINQGKAPTPIAEIVNGKFRVLSLGKRRYHQEFENMGDLLGFLNRNRRCEMHIPVASGSCFLDSLLELEGNSKEKFARCDFFFKNYDAKSLHKCCKYHVEDRDAGIFQQLIIEDRKVETSTKTNFNVSESEEEDEDEEKKGKNLKKRKYNDTFNDLIFQKNVNKEIKIQLENLRKENQKLIFQKRNLSEHKRELNKDLKELEEEVAVTKTAIKAAKKKNKELKKGFEKVKKGKETTWDSDSSESECEFNDTHLEAMKKLADDVEENDNILAENLPKAHVKKLLIEKRQWNRLLTGMTRQLLELRSETSNCNCRFASGAVDAAVSISNSASARAQFMELLGEASVNVSDEEAENIYQILMALFAELFDRDSLTVEEGRFLKKTSSKQILSFIGGLYPRKTRQGSTIVGTFSKCIPEDIHFSCYIKLEKLLTYIPLEVIVHLFSAFKADS